MTNSNELNIYASNYVTSCIEIYQPKGDDDTRDTINACVSLYK